MRKALLMFIILSVSCSWVLAEQEQPQPATMPYLALCQIARLDFKDKAEVTNQVVSFSVGSKNPNVKLADIVLFIDSRSGRIPLAIATNGLMSLPISNELMRENPNIVANQPKGSMTMEAAVVFRGTLPDSVADDKEGLIRYSAIFIVEQMKRQVAHDLTELKKTYDLESALAKPTIVHLRTKGHPDNSGVTILALEGDLSLKAKDPGHFILRFDPKLMKEDPWVRLDPPRKWTMDMETEGDAEPSSRLAPRR